MKCCVSTDVGTWTNLLTFEPDPDYSPDAIAGNGLLSPIMLRQCRFTKKSYDKLTTKLTTGLIVVERWFLSLSGQFIWLYSERRVPATNQGAIKDPEMVIVAPAHPACRGKTAVNGYCCYLVRTQPL